MVKNYFVLDDAAERYNQFRPSIHSAVIDRISVRCSDIIPFESALDVGCGTGHSTYPLQQIASHVTGIDPSAAMLAQTQARQGIDFVQAPAEAIPFPDNHVDLITTGLAFHWFDQPLFLKEAARVMKPGGWLIVYTNWMTGHMVQMPSFTQWVSETYLKRFPTPPRRKVSPEVEGMSDFTVIEKDSFTHLTSMTLDQLTGYLTTQSNIIRSLLDERATLEEVLAWLNTELQPYYTTNTKQDLQFGWKVNYYRLTMG